MFSYLKKNIGGWFAYLDIDHPRTFLSVSLKMILLTICISVYPRAEHFSFLFIPGLLISRITFNRYYWLIISSVFSAFCAFFGIKYALDNHVYVFALLLILGTIAVHLHHSEGDWKKAFGFNARVMMGLIFLFAGIGKLLAPEFLDGSFFEFFLTTDSRFKGFSHVLLKGQDSILSENGMMLDSLLDTLHPETALFFLKSAPVIEQSSIYMTYWTILIEMLTAILFLMPGRYKLSGYREIPLIIFIVTTYPIATVPGFARSLLTLAFIDNYTLNKGRKRILYSLLYLFIFIFTSIFTFPFVQFSNLLFS